MNGCFDLTDILLGFETVCPFLFFGCKKFLIIPNFIHHASKTRLFQILFEPNLKF